MNQQIRKVNMYNHHRITYPTFRRALLLILGLLWMSPLPASGQAKPPKFSSFFAKFQEAVQRKNEHALAGMMSASFDFLDASGVDHAAVFARLNAENGKHWATVQQAVAGSPVIVEDRYEQRPARTVQCAPTHNVYNCVLVFQLSEQNRWRWKGLVVLKR